MIESSESTTTESMAKGATRNPRLVKHWREASIIWRDGREAEGAPLLREYRANNSIEGSNPSLSAIICCKSGRSAKSSSHCRMKSGRASMAGVDQACFMSMSWLDKARL